MGLMVVVLSVLVVLGFTVWWALVEALRARREAREAQEHLRRLEGWVDE